MNFYTELAKIEYKARASTSAPRAASGTINGHTVEVRMAEGYRNTGKSSARWSVDGKTTAAASLVEKLAA